MRSGSAGKPLAIKRRSTKGRITEPRTRQWAHLFNVRYRLLLAYLHHVMVLEGPLYVDGGARSGDGLAGCGHRADADGGVVEPRAPTGRSLLSLVAA